MRGGKTRTKEQQSVDLFTTKMTFKGSFAWVAFLTFTLIFLIIMFITFLQFYGAICLKNFRMLKFNVTYVFQQRSTRSLLGHSQYQGMYF